MNNLHSITPQKPEEIYQVKEDKSLNISIVSEDISNTSLSVNDSLLNADKEE